MWLMKIKHNAVQIKCRDKSIFLLLHCELKTDH